MNVTRIDLCENNALYTRIRIYYVYINDVEKERKEKRKKEKKRYLERGKKKRKTKESIIYANNYDVCGTG